MTPPSSIPNADFEYGNLNFWYKEGDAFTVTSDATPGWGDPFNHKGNYHVWGAKNGDDKTGMIRSQSFYTYIGKPYVDFLIGGGNDIDNLYVALVRADGSIIHKATGTDSEQYRRVIWQVPVGELVYFEVVDNATGSWGHINVDDIHTMDGSIASDSYADLINHDFETGDLAGWTVESGTAFAAGDVTSDSSFWGGPFNQNGTYHLWGHKDGGDGDTGVLSSGMFTLGGHGKIDFLIAGGNDIDRLYVALVRASDGKILFKAAGAGTDQYSRVQWDAATYIGENLYLKVVDQANGDWGHVNIDDVNVQVQPEELFNHTFGYQNHNDLRGWTVVSGYAFSNLDVTSDTSWWGGSFNHDGTSHLWGFKDGGDAQVGILKSENFVLSGTGKIDFLIGGGNDIDNLYVALTRVSDGAELFKATGNNSETYTRVQWDAKQYVGQELYIKVVDNAVGDWGHVNVDDVNVPIQSGTISSDIQAPAAPTSLAVWRQRGTEISFGWTKPADNVGIYGYLITVNGSVTFYRNSFANYTIYGKSGGTYVISVKAVDTAGNVSGSSNTMTAYVP